jgi:hypothetical protein
MPDRDVASFIVGSSAKRHVIWQARILLNARLQLPVS